jgi:hypothetical protein
MRGKVLVHRGGVVGVEADLLRDLVASLDGGLARRARLQEAGVDRAQLLRVA